VTGGALEPGGAGNASTTIPPGEANTGTTAAPAPAPESTDGAAAGALPADVIDQICSLVRATGRAPLHRGDSLYQPELDPDGNGVACE
jgi:hypothetical protein